MGDDPTTLGVLVAVLLRVLAPDVRRVVQRIVNGKTEHDPHLAELKRIRKTMEDGATASSAGHSETARLLTDISRGIERLLGRGDPR